MSPQEYKAMVLRAVKNKEAAQEVIDLFAIPDYSKFLAPFRGYKHFGRAFKGELTVHQFVFAKVEVSKKTQPVLRSIIENLLLNIVLRLQKIDPEKSMRIQFFKVLVTKPLTQCPSLLNPIRSWIDCQMRVITFTQKDLWPEALIS